MNSYTYILFFIITINITAHAQEFTDLTQDELQLISKTSRDYNICVQQNAQSQLDKFADIRKVAAHAVNFCEEQLRELKEKLGSKADSNFYSGFERQLKNRTIKKLLPLLMFEKSSRQNSENGS